MIVVGVVGYVHTPRGLRTLNTVWAGAPHCRRLHLVIVLDALVICNYGLCHGFSAFSLSAGPVAEAVLW